MIIGLFHPEPVGSIITGAYDRTHTETIKATFFILRSATFEEWKNYRLSNGLPIDYEGTGNGFYYEVSTD